MRLDYVGEVSVRVQVIRSKRSYSRWTVTAAFAVCVVIAVYSVLTHALAEKIQKDGTLKTHFANSTEKTVFAEPEAVIALFDLGHATFELDTFLSISFLDRWRQRRWDSTCGHFLWFLLVSHCIRVIVCKCKLLITRRFFREKNSIMREAS